MTLASNLIRNISGTNLSRKGSSGLGINPLTPHFYRYLGTDREMNVVLISMHLCGLLTAVVPSNAQTLVPNPAWQNKAIDIAIDARIDIAKGAIEETLSAVVDEKGQLKLEDATYGTLGNFLYQLAQFDMFTNQTIYGARLYNFLDQALGFRSEFVQGKYVYTHYCCSTSIQNIWRT
ncbi:hypothetical protein PM082_003864 [Marasmius tenuissimus]|nr:hypothetical protein PM082_003864 [Marasmius tenuissimus]